MEDIDRDINRVDSQSGYKLAEGIKREIKADSGHILRSRSLIIHKKLLLTFPTRRKM